MPSYIEIPPQVEKYHVNAKQVFVKTDGQWAANPKTQLLPT